jgi:hypothetical protein
MKFRINDTKVVITTSTQSVELPIKTFSQALVNSSILSELTFSDLSLIWNNLYGIPNNLQQILLKKIELYSSSDEVNAFMYKGNKHWIDKNNRNSLRSICDSSLESIDLVLGSEIISLSPSKLKAFLIKLEDYAHKCYVNTFKHSMQASTLHTPDSILEYDYTTGYPDKITLE